MERFYLLLADVLLGLHGLVVAFNIGALPVIWAGRLRRWSFVRNFYFRLAHLLLIGIVAAEAAWDVPCPLTSLENSLRLRAADSSVYQRSFVGHWMHQLIFWDFAPTVFVVLYGLFFALVLLTFIFVTPRQPKWLSSRHSAPKSIA